MGLLIDGSVLLEHERGRLDLERSQGRVGETFHLSVVSVAALLHGVERAPSPRARALRSAFLEGLVQRFPLLPIDLPAARTHARLRLEMGGAAERLEPSDLWLAAQAVAHGLVLVTGEPRELGRVPGLQLESWMT